MTVLSDRYRLIDRLGEGGVGVVWRARDERLQRDVAIKFLKPFVANDPDQRRRFEREAHTLASLSHDNIVRVFDYDEAGNEAYLVMELIEGRSLAALTFGRLPLGWSEAASYALPVSRALAYAHGRGVIHRDLSPANVLVEAATGRVVVTDFGLARVARGARTLTATGVLIGTPEYWSPEQATGRDTGGSTDMYALGCMLFQLLSGRLPFEGDDRLAVGLRRAHEDAPPLEQVARGTPKRLTQTVDSLLVRDAETRPTAAATTLSLEAVALPGRPTDLTTTVRVPPSLPTVPIDPNPAGASAPPTAAVRPARGRRLRAGLVIAGLAAIALVAATAGYELRALSAATRPPLMPNVRTLDIRSARRRILGAAPQARIHVARTYSVTSAVGTVLDQQPRPRRTLRSAQMIRLTVSRGSPFAAVPSVASGASPAIARERLERAGFHTRYRFMPSWDVGRNRAIAMRPTSGTQVRRPAVVTVLISSGRPRTIVPDLVGVDLATASGRLAADHLVANTVHVLSDSAPGEVVHQSPPAGSTVVQRSRVTLQVARQPRWISVFSDHGDGEYQSRPFTVGKTWRIKYRCDSAFDWLFPSCLADFEWARSNNEFASETAGTYTSGVLQVYYPTGGAGSYRVKVTPYASGTTWSFEIETLG